MLLHFQQRKLHFGLISHVLGLNIFGIFLNKHSKVVTTGYRFDNNCITIFILFIMCKSVWGTNWPPHTHTHTHTHTCWVWVFFAICNSVVLPFSWHERLKTDGNARPYGITQIACRIARIWNLSLKLYCEDLPLFSELAVFDCQCQGPHTSTTQRGCALRHYRTGYLFVVWIK